MQHLCSICTHAPVRATTNTHVSVTYYCNLMHLMFLGEFISFLKKTILNFHDFHLLHFRRHRGITNNVAEAYSNHIKFLGIYLLLYSALFLESYLRENPCDLATTRESS